MEQLYMIEIFIDKVTVFPSEEDENNPKDKQLTTKVKFGPEVEFIIKEGQLAVNEKSDDVLETDERGRKKWSRVIRVGKSYLFPSYPDTLVVTLSKFPLEIEVWTDDDKELNEFIGVGTMHWQTEFFHMLKETSDVCKVHDPLSIKENTPLMAECCCGQVGEISFIIRLSALGNSIITEFQQPLQNPDTFVFRTNKAPSMFECKRIEGDNPNFCMVGSLYETTTLEDPDVLKNANQTLEICTNLQSCKSKVANTCEHSGGKEDDQKKKKYPIDKIRMGDIRGPCGNPNCPLAHKVKMYIRNLEGYKREAGEVTGTKDNTTKNVCGACICKDDRWHREDCPVKGDENKLKAKPEKSICSGCDGVTLKGETCEDKKRKLFGTGVTPKSSKTQVNYVLNSIIFPGYKEAKYENEFITQNFTTQYHFQSEKYVARCQCSHASFNRNEAVTVERTTDKISIEKKISSSTKNNNLNVKEGDSKGSKPNFSVYNCVVISDDKECSCNPPKPTPPCKTFDCDCITEIGNIAARKAHKPFCPQYKHKANCPVNEMKEEEALEKDEEDEAEPLPYGLPPITLGPCPVLGRPCSVPDGFARMYRTAALPPQPPSYSDAGKICCSKQYERIKKALTDYMKYEKDHDLRCVNTFNVDTERRCCDKEQRLLSLMGKECCGAHKLAIQEKFKEEKK